MTIEYVKIEPVRSVDANGMPVPDIEIIQEPGVESGEKKERDTEGFLNGGIVGVAEAIAMDRRKFLRTALNGVLVLAFLTSCVPIEATETATPTPTTPTATETSTATATETAEAMPVVNLNPEIYTVEVASMPEVDRRAFEMAPSEYNMGIKAYSLRLRRVVYVNEENYVVGIYNTGEKHIADEYGNFFEGVQPATGFENVMIVIMGKSDQQFVLVENYKDRTVLDKEGPEKLVSAMRAALASVHLFQKDKTLMPDKSTEWQTWTRGEGAALFAKDSTATAKFDAGIVKLADPIIIVTGLDGVDQVSIKQAVNTVDDNGFMFIGFHIVADSSPYYRAYVSYLTFPRSYLGYSNVVRFSDFKSWYNKIIVLVNSYLGSGSIEGILIQRDIIVP